MAYLLESDTAAMTPTLRLHPSSRRHVVDKTRQGLVGTRKRDGHNVKEASDEE